MYQLRVTLVETPAGWRCRAFVDECLPGGGSAPLSELPEHAIKWTTVQCGDPIQAILEAMKQFGEHMPDCACSQALSESTFHG